MIINFSTINRVRLDEFLRQNLREKLENPSLASNSKIRRLIVAGAVSVNSVQVRRPAFELRGRSHVAVDFDEKKFLYEKQPDDIKYEVTQKDILFEDEYLIVVNKPAFFPTEQTIVGGEKRDNLHDALVRFLWAQNPSLRNPPYAGIMHRLDRETSGAILFTKQRSVNAAIQKMFESHDFTKRYVALCSAGTQKSRLQQQKNFSQGYKWTVEQQMNRISPKSQAAKWGVVPKNQGGLYSRTQFTILENRAVDGVHSFLVEADLFTGRTHQIRVHLSFSGLPILGDELYGGHPYKRIMLHSALLEFLHPVTNQKLSIRCSPDW